MLVTAGSSTGKESSCNAGEPSLIPGSGRSPGEGIGYPTPVFLGFPGGSDSKEFTCSVETWVQSLGQEDPLKAGMATHFSIRAWRIPMTEEEPGRLQFMGLQRVGHN